VVDGVPEPWRSAEGCTSLARFAVSTNTDHRTTIDDGAITAETLLLRAEDEAIQPVEYAHEPDEDIAGDTEHVRLSEAFHRVLEDRTEGHRYLPPGLQGAAMDSIGTGLVSLDVDGHRADVILDRPDKRNAMNEALLGDLRTALEEVEAAEDVHAMTLLGNGPVLSAGMDLEMMSGRADGETELEHTLDDVTHYIDDMSIPSVAGIKGAAIAGAFELVLPVDFRVIEADAKYGVKEVKLGIFPSGGATQRLPRMIGLSKAKELVLTGEFIDPEEAKQVGLVHEVVEDAADVDDRARDWADNLASNAPLGVQRARGLLNSALDMPLEEGLQLEGVLGRELVDSHDYEEGFTAELEGREPEFEGR
jgi:enoyl-CoA hydratase/carnithine racemase